MDARIISSLALAVLMVEAKVGQAADSAGDTVYIGRNATVYHRADCRRLRFERPIIRSEAIERYGSCPVCQPDRTISPPDKTTAPTAAPTEREAPVLPPVTTSSSRTPQPSDTKSSARVSGSSSRKGGGAGRWIGMMAGGVIGFFGGAALAVGQCPWNDTDPGCGAARVIPLTAIGAIGGYYLGRALGGGGHDPEVAIDSAFEQSQDEFRARLAEAALR